MGLTITEKILADRSDSETIQPGEYIKCRPDLIMGHDLTVPHAMSVFGRIGVERIRDPEKQVFIQDHFQPAKDVPSAELGRLMKEFAKKQGVARYYEIGRGGICHILLLEQGFVRPGMFVAGADSHTPTTGAFGAVGYGIGATELAALWALGEIWLEVPQSRKIIFTGNRGRFVTGKDIALRLVGDLGQEGAIGEALEFAGDTLDDLPIADRITIANMAPETGAITVVIPPNRIVEEFLHERGVEPGRVPSADDDASYAGEHIIEVAGLAPLVAEPPGPSHVKPVGEFSDVKVDQVFLGSCTNGTIEDFRRFMEVLGDRKFAQSVRVLTIPATQATFRKALEEGILARIVEAGGAVQTPTCGPCTGGHSGVLAPGEVCLSTSNRNFRGRMGHPDSLVYLASPYVAAATAVTGCIAHPEEIEC